MSGQMLQERGILYTFNDKSGLSSFMYRWKHIPTGKHGMRVVYCFCERDFLALLYCWNTEEWQYVQSK